MKLYFEYLHRTEISDLVEWSEIILGGLETEIFFYGYYSLLHGVIVIPPGMLYFNLSILLSVYSEMSVKQNLTDTVLPRTEKHSLPRGYITLLNAQLAYR